jgi:hypothetical protein
MMYWNPSDSKASYSKNRTLQFDIVALLLFQLWTGRFFQSTLVPLDSETASANYHWPSPLEELERDCQKDIANGIEADELDQWQSIAAVTCSSLDKRCHLCHQGTRLDAHLPTFRIYPTATGTKAQSASQVSPCYPRWPRCGPERQPKPGDQVLQFHVPHIPSAPGIYLVFRCVRGEIK